MNIETGKFYVRGDGEIVQVVFHDPAENTGLVYYCSDAFWRNVDGTIHADLIGTTPYHLVKEWHPMNGG